MRIPDNVTDPKTLRKWEQRKKESDDLEQFARDKGCTVYKRSSNSWSFRRDGIESPYGFDTAGEVYSFIKRTNGNTGIL